MKTKIFAFFIYSINVFFAQTNTFDFDFDLADFRFDNSSKRVEIYYSISSKNFTKSFTQDKSFFLPRIDLNIYKAESDSLIFSQPYVIRYEIDKEVDSYFLGLLNFRAGNGKYVLKLILSDYLDSTKTKEINKQFEIKCISENPSLSGIILASQIGEPSENDMFTRNGMSIIPNARNIIYEKMPVGFYYTELYNLQKYADTLRFTSRIKNPYDVEIFHKDNFISTTEEAIVQVGSFKLKDLVSGKYRLYLELYDNNNSLLTRKTKDFFYASSVTSDSTLNLNNLYLKQDYVTSEFAIMSEGECDEIFRISRYLASPNEEKIYPKLTNLIQKREWLFLFWRQRDKNYDTPENEFLAEYKERAEFVDSKYREYLTQGTETDRGRVYLVYGKPTKIEMVQNDYYNKPYHTWEYDSLEGGVYFIFGDINSLGQYQLLHSTKQGEKHDSNWTDRLKIR